MRDRRDAVRPIHPDVERFLDWLEGDGRCFRWRLEDGKVRGEFRRRWWCPLRLYAFGRLGVPTGPVPDQPDLPEAAGMDVHAVVAALHIVDNLNTSRYFRRSVRDRVLRACRLPVEAAEDPLPCSDPSSPPPSS